MKQALFAAMCVLGLGAKPAGEVTRVRVQIQGCLRSTCSRKVAQALHKGKIGLSSVGDLVVDNIEEGLASFTPQSGFVDLPKMRSELDRAGYGVKLVLIETAAGANIEQLGETRVAVAQSCQFSLPAEWKHTSSDKQQFVWVPKESKPSHGSNLTVCPVP